MKRLDNYDVTIIVFTIIIFGCLWAKEHAESKGVTHGTSNIESSTAFIPATPAPSTSSGQRGSKTNEGVRIAFPLP